MEIRNDKIWLTPADISSAEAGYHIRGEYHPEHEDFVHCLGDRVFSLVRDEDAQEAHRDHIISIPYSKKALSLLTELIEIEKIASKELKPLILAFMNEPPHKIEERKNKYKEQERRRRKMALRVVRD
jgi:hypothetical protein